MGVFKIEKLVLSSSKMLPKEGFDQAPWLPPTPRVSCILHRPWGFDPLVNSQRISLLGGSWGTLALSWLFLPSMTPPRPPKTPPRRPQELPKRPQEPPRRTLGASIRSVILEDFCFWHVPGRSWLILACKTSPRTSKAPSTASKTPSNRLQDAPRTSKTSPRISERRPGWLNPLGNS